MNENESSRPDPDALLAGIHRRQEKSRRGKLKVFFGMCPGVGKTYAMLRAAHDQKTRGTDVVVGWVDTHQRSETVQMLKGLPILPRKQVEHRGTTVDLFDLDAVLERKPALVLVDELAHTNAPGSKHPKRYQDVKDLLVAGIDVYTTMNVQHLESRADLVAQISGIIVRETVPDAFLEFADQIELIDLSPEDLLRRLKDGKVYLGDRAKEASENFFRIEKLTALRELSLRFTAEIVDDHLREHLATKQILGSWNTNERLLVAISHSPFSARLLRSTRRTAFNLEAPWIALHVDTGKILAPADQEMLAKNMTLARELGAEVLTTRDRSIASALRRTAVENHVTQIVMGRPDRRWFVDRFLKGTILDQLVNETSEVDIHVIRQKRRPMYRGWHLRMPEFHSRFSVYVRTAIYVGLLCAAIYPFREFFGYRAIGFGLLLGMLPISTIAGLGPVLTGAFLSAALWNFLFIPPQFTFAIREPEDGMMTLVYFAVASVAGFLAARIRAQESDLREREKRAQILYTFGKKLALAQSTAAIAEEAGKSIAHAFPCRVAVLGPDLLPLFSTAETISERDRAVAAWTLSNGKKAGWKTDTLPASRCLCLPLRASDSTIGVVLLYPAAETGLSLDLENLLATIVGHLATALERTRLDATSRRAEILEESERLHQALLNTVSHELRTPLTAIIGAASTLSERSPPGAMERDIIDAAERLNRTVENLLDMSRIAGGVLQLQREVFDLNDLLPSLIHRLRSARGIDRVQLQLSGGDLFVRGDEKILEHVFANLIFNAIQYAVGEGAIWVESRRTEGWTEVAVRDSGPGIPASELEKVFRQFHRIPGSSPGGVGLGLSIAKTMVEAHGGTITAANRSDGAEGAVFTVRLPAEDLPKGMF